MKIASKVLAVVVLALASPALAQEAAVEEGSHEEDAVSTEVAADATASEPAPEAGAQAEARLEVQAAPISTGTHPDVGLIITGSVMLGVTYLGGAALTLLFSGSALALLPLAHWAVAFDSSSQALGFAIIFGAGFAVLEAVALTILLAGAFHHHPNAPVPASSSPVRLRAAASHEGGMLGLELAF